MQLRDNCCRLGPGRRLKDGGGGQALGGCEVSIQFNKQPRNFAVVGVVFCEVGGASLLRQSWISTQRQGGASLAVSGRLGKGRSGVLADAWC